MKTTSGFKYYQFGNHPRAILCHPSLGTGRYLFHRLIPTLSRSFTVVTWDPRGVGDHAGLEPSLDGWIQDTEEILQDVNKPSFLFGVSLGTWVCGRVAAGGHPLVRSLVMMGATLGFSGGDKQVRERRALFQIQSMAEFAKSYVENTLTPYALPEVKDNLAWELAQTRPENYMKSMEAIYSTPNREAFSRIRVPTLVMVGSLDTRTSPDEADKVHATIPDSHVKVILQAGHLALLDQPERVSEILLSYFDEGKIID